MECGDHNENQRRRNTDSSKKILLTSLWAMAAETSTFPIDLVKTRLQLHGESQSSSITRPTNAFKVASGILRNDGVLGLYDGLSPAIMVASPADLIKVRMQADRRMVDHGFEPKYLGTFDALIKIISNEGFGGLWKGVFPNVQRAFLVNMGEIACYDHAKHFIIGNQIAEDNIYAHTLSSIMSGLSATALSCPADVVKTRMMNEAAGAEGKIKYKNSFDCLVKTVRIEGFRALWKGFFPTWQGLVLGNLRSGFHMRNFARLLGYPRSSALFSNELNWQSSYINISKAATTVLSKAVFNIFVHSINSACK